MQILPWKESSPGVGMCQATTKTERHHIMRLRKCEPQVFVNQQEPCNGKPTLTSISFFYKVYQEQRLNCGKGISLFIFWLFVEKEISWSYGGQVVGPLCACMWFWQSNLARKRVQEKLTKRSSNYWICDHFTLTFRL